MRRPYENHRFIGCLIGARAFNAVSCYHPQMRKGHLEKGTRGMKILREKFETAIQEILDENPNMPVGLALSGGTDSTVGLISLLSMNVQPQLFTYIISMKSPDYLSVCKIAEHYNLTPNFAVVPTERLEEDIEQIIHAIVRLSGSPKGIPSTKTQVFYSNWYLREIIPTGMLVFNFDAADILFGTLNHQGMELPSQISKEKFDEVRKKYLQTNKKPTDTVVDRFYAEKGILYIDPFERPAIIEEFMKYDWHELNEPERKYGLRCEYQEFSMDFMKKVKRRPQQVASGAKKLHLRLGKSKFNSQYEWDDTWPDKIKNRKIRRIYKDIATGGWKKGLF